MSIDDCMIIPCDVTSAPILPQKDIEESLAMVYINENMPFEAARKYCYLFMYWVDKYITKIEDQGCTKIACINRGLFDMHAWKETPYDITLWMVYSAPEDVADHIPYVSKNKIPYSSIDWVDRDIFGMKTLGGKFFYFCNNFFCCD